MFKGSRYPYDPDWVYTPSQSAKHIEKLTLTASGKVDFNNPPEDYAFAAMRLKDGWKEALEKNYDPRFIDWHDFGAYYALAYHELTSPEVAEYMKQTYNNEDLDNIRHNRCQIASEKTGKPVFCPYDKEHDCSTCDRPEKDSGPMVVSLDGLVKAKRDVGEDAGFDIPDKLKDTEAEAEAHMVLENIRRGLEKLDKEQAKKHYNNRHVEAFIKITEEGYESADLERKFKMSKSTVSNMVARIRKEAEKNGFTNPNK